MVRSGLNGADVPFRPSPLGAQSYNIRVRLPEVPGKYTIGATATSVEDSSDPTVSRRWVTLIPGGSQRE